MSNLEFVKEFIGVQAEVYNIAKSKGFHENSQSEGEIICLMHSELSEALEAVRHNNPQSEHISEFSSVEEELADVVIRAMYYAELKGYRLGLAIIEKIKFNKNREYKHGGKKF